ncbi:hypothetical protein ACSBR2_034590 [Camellia fascicularis]
MVFDSIDEIMKFYTRYAKQKGFAVCKRTSSKGNDGEMRYATITCNRGGKQKIRSNNFVKLQPQLKTNCKARVLWHIMKKVPGKLRKGILCKHQITVFMHRKIDQVLKKYIFRRWDKNVKRSHMKVRISYANCSSKPKAHRFNKICNAFYEVADLGAEIDNKCDKTIERIQELKWEFTEVGDVYGINKPRSTSIHNGFPSCGDGIIIPKESRAILDPLALRQKRRPPLKRKQSIVEKVVKKKKERKAKKHHL